MTVEEIISGVTGYFPSQTYEQTQNQSGAQHKVQGDYYANSWIFDWRSTSVKTPVQNQVEFRNFQLIPSETNLDCLKMIRAVVVHVFISLQLL